VERNSAGMATLAILKGVYFNLYKEIRTDTMNDEETERLGWVTSPATKPRMLFGLRYAVDEQMVNVPDAEMVSELRSFPPIEAGNSQKRDKNKTHWDRVIALAICWQMKDHVSSFLIREEKEDNNFDPFSPIIQF